MPYKDSPDTPERITGPLRGYYVAAYACPVPGQAGWVGYFKIFAMCPVSYFDSRWPAMIKGAEDTAVDCPLAAVDQAIESGRLQAHNLPHAHDVEACRQLRPPFVWEKAMLGLAD